jgi:hypothetical protein
LNEAPDVEYRADMAQDIAEFIVAKILVDSKTENPDALEAAERLYGVTMHEKGISDVISIDVSEIEKTIGVDLR